MGQTALRQKQKAAIKKDKAVNKANTGGVCPVCGKVHPPNQRKNLGVKAAKDEVEDLILANTRVDVASEAAQFRKYPPEAAKEQIMAFVEAALETRAEALASRRKWWEEIKTRYPQLPWAKYNIFVDFDTGEFYIRK
jgi:DNA repair exonuclease SbcCD ATPase subunit